MVIHYSRNVYLITQANMIIIKAKLLKNLCKDLQAYNKNNRLWKKNDTMKKQGK